MGHHNQLLTCTVTVDTGCFGMYLAHVGRTALMQSLGYEPNDDRLQRLRRVRTSGLTWGQLAPELIRC
jgi:hypothetical protein